jgi:uncharacterized membrane protein
MCSKHIEAYNKLIIKQDLSWLINKIKSSNSVSNSRELVVVTLALVVVLAITVIVVLTVVIVLAALVVVIVVEVVVVLVVIIVAAAAKVSYLLCIHSFRIYRNKTNKKSVEIFAKYCESN